MPVSRTHIDMALICLFGPQYNSVLNDELPDITVLKQTFRKKSMHYHPDRALVHGLNEELMTEKFKKLNDAYQLLLPFIRSQKPRFFYSQSFSQSPCSKKPEKPFHKTAQPRGDATFPGLRLGQYLCRKGIIDFKTIINALHWQARHRPRVGEIAVRTGLMAHEDLLEIFRTRKLGEKTLDAALRIKILSKEECREILAEQKKHFYPIGRYFVDTGILTCGELVKLLAELRAHNIKASRK